MGGEEVLFGPGAINPNEEGSVGLNPWTGDNLRVANIYRNIVLDASIPRPELACLPGKKFEQD